MFTDGVRLEELDDFCTLSWISGVGRAQKSREEPKQKWTQSAEEAGGVQVLVLPLHLGDMCGISDILGRVEEDDKGKLL